MMFSLTSVTWLVFYLLASLLPFEPVAAAPTSEHAASKRLAGVGIDPPSQDPFYQPPTGFESEDLGTILKYREIEIPLALELLAPGLTGHVYQLLYRSSDSLGQPNAVMAMMFVPTAGDSTKLFSHSVAYDAAFVDCSPSYGLRTLTQAVPDIAVIALGLYSGWYVVTADFESYLAAFGDGIQAGQALLDSFRASLKSTSITGLSPDARIAMNGGSGGALACEWAMELQSKYAPELKIAGATLGSLTPNIANVYNTINGGLFAGLAPPAIIGLASLSPQLSSYLQENLKPDMSADFLKAGKQCLASDQSQFASQNISLYFKNPNFLYDPAPWGAVANAGIMGRHGVPEIPFYVYKGANDEISAVEDTDALIEKYCKAGAPSITYVRNIVTGHEGEGILGIIGAYLYVQDRLNDIPPVPGCLTINSTKSSFNSTDSDLLGTIGTTIVTVLKTALKSYLQ